MAACIEPADRLAEAWRRPRASHSADAEAAGMMAGWTMGIEGWLLMGAWVLVIAVMVWALVREPRHSTRDDALRILRERLARGEITPSEFEQAVHLLDS